jgi:diaminohydroxyphosphoribosylaminopyrimidine deaminase/5-amino-6-(5-phosphoribosylamino)uracil reductase
MARCISLARLGEGAVAPNPMVGAILVHADKIIGEGYHMQYGGPHAEVNCIKSVADTDLHLLKDASIYVSLEPCAHFGKTPPCADLIISKGIKKVVIACRDSYKEVNGKGVQKLQDAGVEVTLGVLEKQAIELNKKFFCFHNNKRPYVILKWAATHDGFVAASPGGRLAISNELTNRYTHHLRATADAIIVGTATALADNPTLTPRFWPGRPPLRIVADRQLKLPMDLRMFTDGLPTIILNEIKDEEKGAVTWVKIPARDNLPVRLMDFLYMKNISSLIVEGGPKLQQSFIEAGTWDEAIAIENTGMIIGDGIKAVLLPSQKLVNEFFIGSDKLRIYQNK